MSAIAAIASQGERAEIQAPAEQLLGGCIAVCRRKWFCWIERLACTWAARSTAL